MFNGSENITSRYIKSLLMGLEICHISLSIWILIKQNLTYLSSRTNFSSKF